MKAKASRSTSKSLASTSRNFEGLVSDLRALITESRRQIVRAVDFAQVQTCWGVGRHIVEFEQGGGTKAEYGAKLLPRLADALTSDFGRGFDQSSLSRMRQFYLAFPILAALRQELTWTHYKSLIRVEDDDAREWYINETISQNWSSRALDRQINRLYYERLLSSRDKKAVRAEAEEKIAELPPSPRDFVRDPVLLEFLGLPETGRLLETDLEQQLVDHLQSFLLELGKGFAFIGRQVRVSTETKDFYIDLVFYNYLLKCFVIFDLRTSARWICMCACMTNSIAAKAITRPSASSSAPLRTPPSPGTPFCTAASGCLPHVTSSCSQPKRNCVLN